MTIRGIMVAFIEYDAPHLFTHIAADGSQFKCSESYVRNYLRTLGWSERCATRAAQKLPANYEQILSDSFLRQAFIIRDHGIPAPLRVNTDQTQMHYQMGGKRTWNKKGAKQVATMGMDEKRAFTLVPSISASGELLPIQTIFHGQTTASCPSPQARRYTEADQRGFKFEPSLTHTYWSTQATMKSLVNDIIAPYFDAKKTELGLPPSQCSLWMIDCWSVHKSEEFRDWMKKAHQSIIISFVPGNLTGLAQPLDVGIQRVLKQSMKRSAHKDIVDETLAHLDSGTPLGMFKLDTTLGTLRDRSVGWMLNAYHDINKKELILKVSALTGLRVLEGSDKSHQAFEMCRAGDFDLSQASLTSAQALAALRELPKTNLALHLEISAGKTNADAGETSDEPAFSVETQDDSSDIPIDVVRSVVMSEGVVLKEGFDIDDEGEIVRTGIAEDPEMELEVEKADENVALASVELGRGRRTKIESRKYGADWEEH